MAAISTENLFKDSLFEDYGMAVDFLRNTYVPRLSVSDSGKQRTCIATSSQDFIFSTSDLKKPAALQ